MKRLLLVYNADSSFLAWVGDFITKILRPAKYPCHLCMLTFGWFSMFPAWRRYINERPEEVVELHRDEFNGQFGSEWDLPAVLLDTDGELTAILSAEEVNKITSLDELMNQVTEKLG